MALEPYETAEAQGTPTVRQQSIFVENRVGQLLQLTKVFEDTDVRILGLTQVYANDCTICRLLLDEPDKAHELLSSAGFTVSEVELVVVSLPHGKRALLRTLTALLRGEVDVLYTYPLLVRPNDAAALAVCTDNIDQAATVLRECNFEMLDQSDLYQTRFD